MDILKQLPPAVKTITSKIISQDWAEIEHQPDICCTRREIPWKFTKIHPKSF
jgi:hypothetical protein